MCCPHNPLGKEPHLLTEHMIVDSTHILNNFNFGCDKSASVSLGDMVHICYQGIFYFQNVILFNGTRVNVRSFLCQISRSSQMLAGIMFRSVTQFHLNREINV